MDAKTFENHVRWTCEQRGIGWDHEAARVAEIQTQHLRALIATGRPRLGTLDRLAKAWNVAIVDLVFGPRGPRSRVSDYGGRPDLASKIDRILARQKGTMGGLAKNVRTSAQALRISLHKNNMCIENIFGLADALGVDPRKLLS